MARLASIQWRVSDADIDQAAARLGRRRKRLRRNNP